MIPAVALNALIFVPVLGALACLLPGPWQAARRTALATAIICLVLNLLVAFGYYAGEGTTYSAVSGDSVVRYVTDVAWIPSVGIHYTIGVDGLSMPLLLLTSMLNILIVLASWNIERHAKAYHCLYLLLMFGMYGVFLALDLFLFYVFFEVSLLPMYFLIGIWGGPRKEYAAIKFFLYTLFGSICLLFVMLSLFFMLPDIATTAAHSDTGRGAIFNLIALAEDAGVQSAFGVGGKYWFHAQLFFMLLFISFAVKVPAVPFHTWLPDAHVEAPTPISMILAGVLLKMGGYALMRISYPIFPEAARWAWFVVAVVGVVSIVYGALCAMAQTDWKKLVAYSSVSHMGYVVLGLAVMTPAGLNGAYFQMIGHGVSSAMMFYIVGVVYERAHHRDLNRLGGLWNTMPAYTGLALVGSFAALGLPLLCGFPGELLSMLGTFQAAGWLSEPAAHVPFSGANGPVLVFILGGLAASGVILTAAYVLWMVQRVFMGPAKDEYSAERGFRVVRREYAVLSTLAFFAVLLGCWPKLIFDMTDGTFRAMYERVTAVAVSVEPEPQNDAADRTIDASLAAVAPAAAIEQDRTTP